jgi:hypothetical protein
MYENKTEALYYFIESEGHLYENNIDYLIEDFKKTCKKDSDGMYTLEFKE